ncbi:MAG: hypothetical protein V4721_13055 [Bacteroidota bacterium]
MKICILFIVLMVPGVVFSQSQDSIFQYCQVRIIGKTASRKINIEVDYGQEQKKFDKASIVKDLNGDLRIFNSVADALNYMGSLGWRVIQSYMIGSEPSLSNSYFLMETRKKITE